MPWVMWSLVSVHLEVVLVEAQDRCTVCAVCTSGMEIILGIPDGTPSKRRSIGTRFDLFGDSVHLGAR